MAKPMEIDYKDMSSSGSESESGSEYSGRFGNSERFNGKMGV